MSFSGTGQMSDGCFLSVYVNGEIVDDFFVRHARVGKFHMGEYHIALYFFYICHLCGFIFQLFLGKELKTRSEAAAADWMFVIPWEI